MSSNLSAEALRSLVHYEPTTGAFTRLTAASNAAAGSQMGCPAKNGYLRARVSGALFYCHRLAFLYMTGNWPAFDVDHVDGDRSNNRWANLREAKRKENSQNIAAFTRSRSGVRNVYFDEASQRWQVKIMKGGRSISYGYFRDLHEAALVAQKAKAEQHNFHPEISR